ncbi:hypothetical protein LTR60_003305 [Cryomyces antarcticus]|nr:hypothetical protein LTR60_003305 [Cryomyces antarcticus]
MATNSSLRNSDESSDSELTELTSEDGTSSSASNGALTLLNRTKQGIQNITHLHLTLDASTWSDFEDDMWAMALAAFDNGHFLQELKITIVGPIRFEEYDYVSVTPKTYPEHITMTSGSNARRDPDTPNEPAPAAFQSLQKRKHIFRRVSRSPTPPPEPVYPVSSVTRKAVVGALLAMTNIPTVVIAGPMSISLRQLLITTMATDATTPSNAAQLGLRNGDWRTVLAVDVAERAAVAARQGMLPFGQREQDEGDFGQTPANPLVVGRYFVEEWIVPTGKKGSLTLGWRARGAWMGPGAVV